MATFGITMPGDTVVTDPCPEHEANMVESKGIFVLELSELNKISGEERENYIKNADTIVGCVGNPDCSIGLAEAIEED